MRNSHIAMLSALGALLLGVVIVIGAVRVAFFDSNGDGLEPSRRSSDANAATISRDLTGFSGIDIRSSWSVELERGDTWNVLLEVPEGDEDDLNVYVDGNRLVLDAEGGSRRGWGWFGGSEAYEARITLPDLDAISISSSGNVELDDFEGDSLTIMITGAGNIEGDNSSFEQLVLEITGAGNVDFKQVAAVDARVQLSGAANVELNMDGGELSGYLSGFGNVTYRGTVSNEAVRVSGFGNVGPE